MTHRPPTPFGCLKTWPVHVVPGVDGRTLRGLHVCISINPKHQGPHVCACGEKAT